MAISQINQNSLGQNVVGNGPAFSAYPNATQSLSATSTTKLQFNVEDFDTASCYNNTGSTVGGIPAYSFLPNVAGYYQITILAATSAADGNQAGIFKNGSVYVYGAYAPSNQWAFTSTLVYLNGSTDYVDARLYTGTASTTQAVSTTKFQGVLVRAA